MAGDEPGVQREWTHAGRDAPQGKGSELVGSRQVHKHRRRKDNGPSIPSHVDTKVEATDRP
jgi:hypothetical protein